MPVPLGRYHFTNEIPKDVREFNKVVDPTVLEPGDLILVCHLKPPWISRKIQSYQQELYDWDHARWHHAVVSGGDVEICEATRWGVEAREYWRYMTGHYDLRVRRIATADAAARAKVAYYAATMARTPYGFLNVLGILVGMARGNLRGRLPIRSSGVICSQLYFEACMRIGVLLSNNVRPESVTPSHLSASGQMIDVPLQWKTVR